MENQINKVSYIYKNRELVNFFNNLENKYAIYDGLNYCNLINFSQNKDVPFYGWLRYREGYSGTLVKMLMEEGCVSKGEIVVDPFCGSGTTSIVAKQNGCIGFGCDINPMSSFVTNIKLKTYSTDILNRVIDYLEQIKNTIQPKEDKRFESIKRYFAINNFEWLCSIRSYIDKIDNKDIKDILLVSFICIVEECSDRKKDGNGLKTSPTKVKDVVDFFVNKVRYIVNDLITANTNTSLNGYNYTVSAMDFSETCKDVMQQTNSTVGAVIFSPPYANSFDYLETYKLELVFGGFVNGITGLNDLRKTALRSFIGVKDTQNPDYYVNMLATEIESAIPEKESKTHKRDARTRKVPTMIKGYFFDMEQVLKECAKILLPNKKVFIVVDQSSYLGKIVPTDLLLGYMAEQNGFKVEKILKTKNANTSAQQLRDYPYLKGNLRGSIVVLQKV